MFKVLTIVIKNRLNNHLIKNQIFPPEQKGYKKSSRGCKDQLLLDLAMNQWPKKEREFERGLDRLQKGVW